jgi:predicted nucleic acid-binding protein
MRRFFDTNVLVYLFEERVPRKRTVAQELLTQCASRGNALISIQVLQEFYVTVTRKFAPPLPRSQVEDAVRELSRLPMVAPDAGLVFEAIATSHRYHLSFWDSLIIQAALRGGASILYSEDLQHGQVFETLTVQNPFA